MKKIIKAFSLVELIVVSSIITLITISWGFYFFDFLDNFEITNKTQNIENKIKELDLEVKNHEIFDYKIFFSTTNSWSYIIYKNIFDTKINQTINSDLSKINTNNLSWETWFRKIYKDIKLESFSSWTIKQQDKNFVTNYDYNIQWLASWSTDVYIFNEIDIVNFDKNNKNLSLIDIKENNINSIEDLEIINIWWKKSFSWTSANTINEVFIYFENKWKQGFLKIKK